MKVEEVKVAEIVSAHPAEDAVVINSIIKQAVDLATNPENTPIQRFHTIVLLTQSILDVFDAARDESANYLIGGQFIPKHTSVETNTRRELMFNRHKNATHLEVDGCKFSWMQFANFDKLARKNDKLAAKIKIRNQKEKDLANLYEDISRDVCKMLAQKEFAKTKPSSVHNQILFDDLDFLN